MHDRDSTVHDLAALLQQLTLQQAERKLSPEVTQDQIKLLLSRIVSLTGALRDAADTSETFRTMARLLLADLAMVTAQFRADTIALGERLNRALEDARLVLDNAANASML